MKPQINVITLAVNDLDKSLVFYRDGLGLPTQGIVGSEFHGDGTEPDGTIVFFDLNDGLKLALYPRTELVKDANVVAGASGSTEFSLGYLTDSKDEVDALMEKAEAAGATITDRPHHRPWGIYSGYFADLDGHLWEIIYNPGRPLDE